ncbi:hypothetical protein OSTOST_20791, partial [Ostertagia ostertagi]
MNLPTDLYKSPPSLETHSTARPLVTEYPASKATTTIPKQTPSKRLLTQEHNIRASSGDVVNKETQQVAFRVPFLPTPRLASPPNLASSNARIDCANIETKRKASSRPTSPKGLLFPLPRRVLNSSSADEDRSEQFSVLNKPSNARGADSSLSLTNRDESFEPSNEMKAAILNSTCDEDMEATIGRHLRLRPSVAFIQKQGIVRDRVNMFRQLGNSMSVPLASQWGR